MQKVRVKEGYELEGYLSFDDISRQSKVIIPAGVYEYTEATAEYGQNRVTEHYIILIGAVKTDTGDRDAYIPVSEYETEKWKHPNFAPQSPLSWDVTDNDE